MLEIDFLTSEDGAVTADYAVFMAAVSFSAVAALDAHYDALHFQTMAIIAGLDGSTIISTDFEQYAAIGQRRAGGSDGEVSGNGAQGGEDEKPAEDGEESCWLRCGDFLEDYLEASDGGDGNGNGGSHGNNGYGNGDQDAPGNSEYHNNAENAGGNHGGTGEQGNGNAVGNGNGQGHRN